MPPETKLRNRIAELEARVAEADETLRAIRNGEVDAFVVAGNRGERVYTLTGADQTYRILIEEMREGALTLSADGLILYSNRRFAELIGLPLEQVAGTFLSAYAAERDGERVTAMLRRQANEPNRGEITLMHADGRPIPTFFAINELEIDGARLLCLVVTDLTEQKHAEEIVAAEMLARAIFDQAAEAIVVVDQEGAIVRASQAAHKLAGDNVLFRKFEDALPLRFLETSTFKDGGALRAAACAGRTIKGVEATLPRGADRPVSVLVSAGPLTGEGHETLGCVMTITDITLRKLVEERIRQSQKMESLGRLAGGIAHDFNNLLTGIVGNASLISDMVGEEAKSSLEDIIASGQRAAELTRQLLAYAGKGRFFMERLDLSAVVEHTLPLIRPSLPKKVELSTDLCADAPRFEADRNQIQQVVLNLVLNAGEAIGDRPGRITIQTGVREGRVAEAQGTETRRYICLEVSDNGCGMDEATRQKIFDPFFTTKFIGRGLGLAAVEGIVHGCRGAIKVESSQGEGSTFTVLFPALEAAAGRTGRAETSDTSGVVLVAEDEPVVRDMTRMALKHFGYAVITADDGQEAVERFAASPDTIDLVVLDVRMPVMDGREALRHFRRLRPGVKVLVSSGYNEAEALRAFESEGVAGFIQKPYTAAELGEAIRKAMAGPGVAGPDDRLSCNRR